MKTITLNNGVEMPVIGFGTFRTKDEEAYESVRHAIDAGYRLIDTAEAYGNEEAVGRAVRDSGVPREELFVATKLWKGNLGYMSGRRALHASLKRLGLDYVDLYIIHWPAEDERNLRAYRALESLYFEGRTRTIGVSNFSFHHLEHLLEHAEIAPQVNQVETHLRLQNERLQEFCMMNDIYLEAYAPLMSSRVKELLEDETLLETAKKHGKTPAQVALRYLLEREIVPIPKSATKQRIEENIDIFDFALDETDRKALREMNKGLKTFPDPDNFLIDL